jgi:hypothetical protein
MQLAVGIANTTVKRQRSQLMGMRLFWVSNKVAQDMHFLVGTLTRKILLIIKASITLGRIMSQ